MKSKSSSSSSVPEIGKREQQREYRGITVYLSYRPMTKDFRWVFYRQHTMKIDGVEKTIDKCMKAAAQYIDRIPKKSPPPPPQGEAS